MKLNVTFVITLLFLTLTVNAHQAETLLPDSSLNLSADSTDTLSSAKNALKQPTHEVKKPTAKNYNHREQVIFAAGMMAFIGLILGTSQMWNPD